ncbi:MAG: SCO family protein [Pyrinomonadaceae bacterium]
MQNKLPHAPRFIFISLLALCCFSLHACQPRNQSRGQHYDLKGKVVSVDKEKQTVTIAHEEIKGYMGAMVMPFKLKEDWAFTVLVPGDQISGTLVVDGASSWLEDVVITSEGEQTSGADNTEGLAEPKPGDEVPDFALTNQDGKRIHLAQYRGKALLLTFIYTRCPLPEYCTLMSNNFALIDKELQKDADLYSKTHLLSISFDTEYDTPKVLRSYGASHTGKFNEETFEHWEFASGTPDEVKGIAQHFGLRYFKESDQIIHMLRTAIITPDGKVFKIYRGNEWKTDEVLQDLRSLMEKKQ